MRAAQARKEEAQMAQHRSFGAARQEAAQDPITFDVAGEMFNVPMPFPAMAMLDIADAALTQADNGLENNDPAAVKQTLQSFHEFLAAALGDEQFIRFKAAALRARMGLPELLEVMQFVMQEATGRPFTQPSSSPVPPSVPSTSSTGPTLPPPADPFSSSQPVSF
jgi:hypothetical protein